MLHSCRGATGGNWYKSPMHNNCTPPKGTSCLLRTDLKIVSIASIVSQRTMLISSITNSSLLRRISCRRFTNFIFPSNSLLLAEVGKNGLKGNWNKLCKVTPPALIAATPVGAATIIFLEQFSFKYFRKVVFPVPALPVRKIFSLVSVTKRYARSNISLCSIGFTFSITFILFVPMCKCFEDKTYQGIKY